MDHALLFLYHRFNASALPFVELKVLVSVHDAGPSKVTFRFVDQRFIGEDRFYGPVAAARNGHYPATTLVETDLERLDRARDILSVEAQLLSLNSLGIHMSQGFDETLHVLRSFVVEGNDDV